MQFFGLERSPLERRQKSATNVLKLGTWTASLDRLELPSVVLCALQPRCAGCADFNDACLQLPCSLLGVFVLKIFNKIGKINCALRNMEGWMPLQKAPSQMVLL